MQLLLTFSLGSYHNTVLHLRFGKQLYMLFRNYTLHKSSDTNCNNTADYQIELGYSGVIVMMLVGKALREKYYGRS